MTEEIEVNVRQIDENGEHNTMPLNEVLRKLLMAGIGAMALTRDEIEGFVTRLVERGELAQKDGEKIMNEVVNRVRHKPEEATSNFGEQLENGLEQFLNRLNIPSKRDIDELSAKIAQLAARVEELRRSNPQAAAQDQPEG